MRLSMLFEEIRVLPACVCGRCCNTETSTSLSLSRTCACAQVRWFLFFLTAMCRSLCSLHRMPCTHHETCDWLTHAHSAWLKSDEKHHPLSSEQQIMWRIFWQRASSPQCSRIHCWLCGKLDEPMNQMMSAAFLADLSLPQHSESAKQWLWRWQKPEIVDQIWSR